MKSKTFIGLITVLLIFTCFSFAPMESFAQSGKAKKLVSDGDKEFNRKNYQAAIDKYAQAIVLAPNYAQAYYQKGLAHYNLNQYEQAIKDLSAALDNGHPRKLEIYKIRGYMNLQSKNFDAALVDYTEASKLDPKNIQYLSYLSEIYINKKDWKNALEMLNRASQLDPQNGDISYQMAFCYSQMGNLQEQGTAAAEALKKGTRFVGEAYFLYGDSQNRARNWTEAMQAFERAINANPKIYASYSLLAEIYRAQGRFQDAINVTLKGLEHFPDDGNLYISLTWFYSLADKQNDAVQAGLQAIKFAPNTAMSYTNLCRAYNDVRQYSSAIETCNKALEISPDDGETNFYLGRAYTFLNREDVARRYYAKAVTGLLQFTKDNPDYSDGFYLLGNAYAASGNRDKAIEAYRRCLELSPRFAKARFNLGYILFQKGDKAGAREQYEELRKFDAVTAERLRREIEN